MVATQQHCYPLLQPQKLYSRHSFQHALAGNCLDAVEVGGQTVVVHIDYASSNQAVVASRLVPGKYYQKDEPMAGDTYFHLEMQDSILVNQYVNQVVSEPLHNDIQVLVRTPTSLQLLSGLRQTKSGSSSHKMLSGSITSDAALNSVIPGLCSLATVTGKVTLHNTNAKQPVWTSHCRETEGVVDPPARLFKCGFGRHPYFLYVGNESSVNLYDTRVHPKYHRTLFNLKNIKDQVFSNERICSFVSSSDWSHLYVVMDEGVYVVDDRQQKSPLMHWRHMLSRTPTYSILKKQESLELLILSNSLNKEVCMISSEWECGRQQCNGVSVPCHFPIFHNTTSFAQSHGLWFTNQLLERLEDSSWLGGVASVPHPAENGRLLFFSMLNSGDIFFNTFQSSFTKLDSAVLSEDGQGLSILGQWETDIMDISTDNWSYHSVNYCDVTSLGHQLLRKASSGHEEIPPALTDKRLKNYSVDKIKFKGLPKNKRNEETFSISKKNNDRRKHSRKIPNGKKIVDYTVKSASEKILKWNLKDQILQFKDHHRTTKCIGGAAWNKSLIGTYVTDPSLDESVDLPLHFGDPRTEDSIRKFLPRSMQQDLKMDKIRKCKDLLSPKILSLWFDGQNLNIKNDKPGLVKSETDRNGQLSAFFRVMEGQEKIQGFQYHTAPVDLSRLSAKVISNQSYSNRADQSPNLDNPSAYYSLQTREQTVKLPAKPKRQTPKLKKKKRVDGF